MLEIDGSHGEGGGQILRSALALAAVTGRPVHLTRIRANRSKPGLRPQHLTAVLAMAEVCEADTEGAELGSQELTFAPQAQPAAGDYRFAVADAAAGGSAGSVTLILQTLLLPLALAEGPSEVTLLGGTTVPMSPPALYVDKVLLPTLFEMGLRASVDHRIWGFYPRGDGELTASIRGGTHLRGLDLTDPGGLVRVEGTAFAARLPSHIPQRMANRARNILHDLEIATHIVPEHVSSPGVGTGLFLCARYERAQAGFLSLGRLGLPAEEVAEIACRALVEHHRTSAAADPHLADQLVLPFALAEGPSRITVSRVTRHLLTSVWVAQQFGFDWVRVEGEVGRPGLLTAGDWN
ncbi:MAG: RNA 3'-phosphate cyclase [Anaerolineae bacterium]|nr:RNA 3'-phosphate cyclase [Anaerolineae bacterium]